MFQKKAGFTSGANRDALGAHDPEPRRPGPLTQIGASFGQVALAAFALGALAALAVMIG